MFKTFASCAAFVAILTVAATSPAVTMSMTATINGAQETPPNGSAAIGSGTFVLDTVANTLSFNITIFVPPPSGEIAAHIHGPAAPGAPAAVLFPLPPGSPKIGVWAYTEVPDEANILAGLTYVNIHSNAFGGGEIRGQIIPMHDSIVVPRGPFKPSIPTTMTTVIKYVKVTVKNVDDKTQTFPNTLQLVPGSSCTGITIGTPDFDPMTPATEDTVVLASGKSKAAKIAVTLDSTLISTPNAKAPLRCTVNFTSSTVVAGGNADPSPTNNTFALTIDVIDKHDLP